MVNDPIPADPPAKRQRPDVPFLIKAWLWLTALAPYLLRLLARRLHKRQGGDASRLCERFGTATVARPDGPLIWIHAASVGETVSALALARRMCEATGATVLFTTSTASGAETLAKRFPEALHQFLPIDTRKAVHGFLSHWRPDAAIFIEGDLWPRLSLSLSAQGIPAALINARASKSRARFPRVYRALLSRMEIITAQDDTVAARLVALGLQSNRVHSPGNLKAEIEIPKVDPDLCREFTNAAAGRSIWAAVSTHPGEDEIVLDAHASIEDNPLLLLVPRHPDRGGALAELLATSGISYTRDSAGETPNEETSVHLIDSFGVTGTVYASAGLALVGGSLVPGLGGHTPFEPAALGCATIHGPHVQNFNAAYNALQAAGGALEIACSEDLQPLLQDLLSDSATLSSMQNAGRAEFQRQSGAVARTLVLLKDVLPSGSAETHCVD